MMLQDITNDITLSEQTTRVVRGLEDVGGSKL